MNLLSNGQQINIGAETATVESPLGSGGQGEVYHVRGGSGETYALKWYFPQSATQQQKKIIRMLCERGAPNDRFLWPLSLATAPGVSDTWGYVMPLRDARYHSFSKLMTREVKTNFAALTEAGSQLVTAFKKLHTSGLCYCDISFGNVFFDPKTGDILICDNDNVGIDGENESGVVGTQGFMAPEVMRGEAKPSSDTDRYSLAVLLFHIFMMAHPLDGLLEASIKCMDLPARNKLYGTNPLFIFHPTDTRNRPHPEYHKNAMIYWNLYPAAFQELFTRSFTEGIAAPDKRLREGEWEKGLQSLEDSLLSCGYCPAKNFYDVEKLRAQGSLACCICTRSLTLPARMRLRKGASTASVVVLGKNKRLYARHLSSQPAIDTSLALGAVESHPTAPAILGLKNLSSDNWTATLPDGAVRDIAPGKSVLIKDGTSVDFGGGIVGEIRA